MEISENIQGTLPYWSQVSLSSIIAAFGLLQNSVAVIIGAMLIAPLLLPIKGIAFGISTGQTRLFWRSSLLLCKSVGIGIALSAIVVLLLPLHVETSEILARTSPNLIDFFVAIASAIIAFLAIHFEQLSESIGGVAMATALMPPLAVVGIEIAFGNVGKAWGGFFLFLTNLFSIVFVGIILFFIYGFMPHQETTQKNAIKQLTGLLLLGVFILIPLASSLLRLSDAVSLKVEAYAIVDEAFDSMLPEAKLTSLELVEHSGDEARFEGTVVLPEEVNLYEEVRDGIRSLLSRSLERDVSLDLQVLRIASIVSQKNGGSSSDQFIRDTIRTELGKTVPQATIVRLDVTKVSENPDWSARLLLALPSDQYITTEQKNTVHAAAATTLSGSNLALAWTVLPLQAAPKAATKEDQYRRENILLWQRYIDDQLTEGALLKDLQFTWTMEQVAEQKAVAFSVEHIAEISIMFDVHVPQNEMWRMHGFRTQIQTYANKVYQKAVTIEYRVYPFSGERITTTVPAA